MGRVRFRMSGYLLRELMHLPEGVTLAGASMPWDEGRETVEFVVEGDGLPEPIEGCPPLLADPIVTKYAEKFSWDWRL